MTSFIVPTCEGRHRASDRRIPIEPNLIDPDRPFELGNPFGLRKAVLPVFRRDPQGRIFGQGTAFHVDGFGTVLTANHVVDFAYGDPTALDPKQVSRKDPAEDDHLVLMLGMGLVYGQASIPHHAWAPVGAMTSPAVARDNPMALLRGETAYAFEPDVCAMQLVFDRAASLPETLAVKLGPWSPTVGERVLAVGYPQLLPSEVTPQQQRMLVSDGLYGAYGTVTAVGNEGDDVNRRRRIRVEADWPLGMSGGPVFNEAGEVVAIVSTGIDPTDEHKGIAFAVSMGLLPELNAMLPSLIPGKPGWRRAYGVLRETPWHLQGVSSFLREAQAAATRLGGDYRVVFGEHQIGTDNFITLQS